MVVCWNIFYRMLDRAVSQACDYASKATFVTGRMKGQKNTKRFFVLPKVLGSFAVVSINNNNNNIKWKLKSVVIVPIVLPTIGIIPKQLYQSLKYYKIYDMKYYKKQKTVILNTCRIVRQFLQLTIHTEQINTQTNTSKQSSLSSSPY
jgi:hypothetical protein